MPDSTDIPAFVERVREDTAFLNTASNNSEQVVFAECRLIDAATVLADEVKRQNTELDRILSLVRTSLKPHGICLPRERLACSACNATDKLRDIIKQWKGPKVRLAQTQEAR